jgi:hypothetical protein
MTKGIGRYTISYMLECDDIERISLLFSIVQGEQNYNSKAGDLSYVAIFENL